MSVHRPLTACGEDALPVTCSAQGEPYLSRAILSILQYDLDPVGDAKRATDPPPSEGDEEKAEAHTVCLVGRCLDAQILSSVGIAVDDHALEALLVGAPYLPWEVAHARLVLRFCRTMQTSSPSSSVPRSEGTMLEPLSAILADCAVALRDTPADVFTGRLAMILAFLSGDYAGLRDAMWAALQGTPLFKESATQRLGSKSWLRALLSCCTDNRVEKRFLASRNITTPYLMSFFAFALEEIGFSMKMTTATTAAATATTTHDRANADDDSMSSEDYLEAAKSINDAALQFVQHWNSLEGQEDHEGGRRRAFPFLTHVFAVHVVCHLHESLLDPRGGIDAVLSIPAALWQTTAHLVVHCWWHVALFQLDCGDCSAAMRTFQEKVLPHVSKYDPFSLSDATAFLARCALLHAIPRLETAEQQLLHPFHEGDGSDGSSSLLSVLRSLIQQVDLLWDYWRSGRRPLKGGEDDVVIMECGDDDEVRREEFVRRLPFFFLHRELQTAMASTTTTARTHTAVCFPPAALLEQLLKKAVDASPGSDSELLRCMQETWTQVCGGRRTWWQNVGGSGAQRELLFRTGAFATTLYFAREAPTAAESPEEVARLLEEVRRDIELRASVHQLWTYQTLIVAMKK